MSVPKLRTQAKPDIGPVGIIDVGPSLPERITKGNIKFPNPPLALVERSGGLPERTPSPRSLSNKEKRRTSRKDT